MTNQEKLEFIKSEFNIYISNIETLTQFKTFLNNITKAKVITALKNRIQSLIDTRNEDITSEQVKINEMTDLKNKLDKFLS